jgi:hypothetical protein
VAELKWSQTSCLCASVRPTLPTTKGADELTCPLSTAVFVEGKPQRPHRLLVTLSSRTLVFRSSVVHSVGKQIPGWSRQWSSVSGV